MSNSFNISVKPEIAAVSSLVSANGVIIADIHDTDLPAVKTDTADIRTNVTAIHDTDLPAVKTDTGYILTGVTSIHDVLLPAVVSEIDDNETKIDNVKTVADAIQAKTDAMPQNVRSKFYRSYLNHGSSEFTEVCNVTGHGILYGIGCSNDGADTMEIRVTIDGFAFTDFVMDTSGMALMPKFDSLNPLILSTKETYDPDVQWMWEYWESLLVETRRSAGSTAGVLCKVYYSVDQW
ncbi:hypothetical protein ES703_15471 [subsurface metagenome]